MKITKEQATKIWRETADKFDTVLIDHSAFVARMFNFAVMKRLKQASNILAFDLSKRHVTLGTKFATVISCPYAPGSEDTDAARIVGLGKCAHEHQHSEYIEMYGASEFYRDYFISGERRARMEADACAAQADVVFATYGVKMKATDVMDQAWKRAYLLNDAQLKTAREAFEQYTHRTQEGGYYATSPGAFIAGKIKALKNN